jgi:acetylornithine deacetylase
MAAMDVARTISVLEGLVGFDTTSRNSNLALIGWVEAYLDRLGVGHARVPDETGTKANLIATIGNPDAPGYILSGHTDVVPVDGQSWSSDPFRLAKRDGRLYGRGTSDMKGFVACCLAAVPDMLARELKQPIHLAFSYDEEVGCIGVRGIIDRLRHWPIRPAACFVGEPTCMQVVIGHKAKRSVVATVQGRTVHSSLAPLGVNAVEYAARVISKVRDIAERLAHEGPRDPLYDVPHSTAHTGLVHGGSALNIVPDQCTFEYEFRTIAADDPSALADEVADYAHDVLDPQMKAVAPEAGITLRDRSSFPGLDTAPNSEIVGLSMAFSGRNDLAKVAFGTEAGGYAADGIPSIVVGPGSIDQAHKADEFIAVSELEKCGVFIDRLIDHCSA